MSNLGCCMSWFHTTFVVWKSDMLQKGGQYFPLFSEILPYEDPCPSAAKDKSYRAFYAGYSLAEASTDFLCRQEGDSLPTAESFYCCHFLLAASFLAEGFVFSWLQYCHPVKFDQFQKISNLNYQPDKLDQFNRRSS